MTQTNELSPGGYYIFESLSSSKSAYFNSDEEIRIFRVLLSRYLGKYIHIHRIYIDVGGYQLLLKLKGKQSIISQYSKECAQRDKLERTDFIAEPWRIISEKIRIFHSTYAKTVNKLRGREGVLVKNKYAKYYFEDLDEATKYVAIMDTGGPIVSQSSKNFQVIKDFTDVTNWLFYRTIDWLESAMDKLFQDFVGRKLVNSTLSHHQPSHQAHTQH